ncbi:peptide chain release factor N(5)-glutamine methyltransferase [Desulfoprunum benzoelyticum]|uniref:Release factor glutamine methyltransferase n=1 Tax=Desulfoprunum benzoelyticum TaxID=1506996 RepID=A0A840V6W1_9BACT|nr:peptide chain release factor N(5)-glutamine methyltransferase [Desulfoprunum benzoelyticum]MBB5348761.1 release factor glutamine methyltransferase [Desulfoprunum benzoelyticum]MBM9529922.1 peptide chain release factor N(5)-glutamine methyltransferase [Desulfoprunum benzoelyticum]
MQVIDLLHTATRELAEAGVDGGDLDGQLLLGACLNKSRTELFLAADMEVPEEARRVFLRYLERRKRREPIAYILGEREFWSLPFIVNPSVLIPRPETEFLVEQVLAACRPRRGLHDGWILDLCCGSGAIAVVLALELQRDIVAVDISCDALAVAQQNCRRHKVDDRVALVKADLLTAFAAERRFSLLVSNPPYVSRRQLRQGLDPEVAGYEPLLALDGGEDGLDIIARIKEMLPVIMRPGGEVFIEIGAEQGPALLRMFAPSAGAAELVKTVEILKDYAGRDRVLHLLLSGYGR